MGPHMALSQLKKKANTSQKCVYHSQLLISTFWRKFYENPKKAKLQMHENLQKSVNENMFLFIFLYKFS